MTTGAADQSDALDLFRAKVTFWIALAGIGGVVLVTAIAVGVFHGAKNPGELIPAVVGSVTGAIGTLAGLVAGHSAGAAGKAQAEQRAAANTEAAAAGRVLAHAVVNDASSLAGAPSAGVTGFGAAPPPAADLAQQHAALARKLFPDVNGG